MASKYHHSKLEELTADNCGLSRAPPDDTKFAVTGPVAAREGMCLTSRGVNDGIEKIAPQ